MPVLKFIMSILFGALLTLCTAAIICTTGLDPLSSVGVACILFGILSYLEYRYKDKMPEGLSFVTLCGKMNRSNERDCDNPVQAGTRDRMIVLNEADIDSVTFGADGYTIEAITMVVAKTGFVIEGKNNSIVPRAEMIEQGVNDMFDHEVITKGFDISPEAKSDFNSAKDGRFVIIVENFFKGVDGKSAFEAYGLTAGLEITALSRMPNDSDTQGAFDITYFTKINKEPKLPNPFFITDYATTKAAVDSLLV